MKLTYKIRKHFTLQSYVSDVVFITSCHDARGSDQYEDHLFKCRTIIPDTRTKALVLANLNIPKTHSIPISQEVLPKLHAYLQDCVEVNLADELERHGMFLRAGRDYIPPSIDDA